MSTQQACKHYHARKLCRPGADILCGRPSIQLQTALTYSERHAIESALLHCVAERCAWRAWAGL